VAGAALTTVRIGTAGWALPKTLRGGGSTGGPVLAQYAARFDAVEINSSFYRPHRRSTYERWRDSVPESFRFSVKLPKTITHELGLARAARNTRFFMESTAGLERKLAVLLVQLPPSLDFEARVAGRFFKMLRGESPAHIACEARSPSWFVEAATAVLAKHGITRVAADPVPPGCEIIARAQPRFRYFRLHGSPRMYYSAYSLDHLQAIAAAARAAAESWCIFDNTAAGAAWPDAITLQGLLGASAERHG
jgi:uncharacterized protein YecE (DUF72 family)